jgi:hypothetical protein
MIWPDPIGLGLLAVLNFSTAHLHEAKPGLVGVLTATHGPTFKPVSREVSNWRFEAMAKLDSPIDFATRTMASKRDVVPRCIRLNNYWCIKRAGWAGEIAADAEGHVAFASVEEGAIVAAKLLRRYYMDFGRHDALAIISHWAPAQCGTVAFRAPRIARPKVAHAPRMQARHRLALSTAIAPGFARYGLDRLLHAQACFA